jgi:hypothetical protein
MDMFARIQVSPEKVVKEDSLFSAQGPTLLRCPACQLQLCKGRGERPHTALADTRAENESQAEKRFVCRTCDSILINSSDLTSPGWRHHRS